MHYPFPSPLPCLDPEKTVDVSAVTTIIIVNPFTAMLTVPSLGKWPIKAPNLKSLRLFLLVAWARERTSIKMHSIKSRLVIGPSNILFGGMYVRTFQPGNFTGEGSEGVNINGSLWSCYMCYTQQDPETEKSDQSTLLSFMYYTAGRKLEWLMSLSLATVCAIGSTCAGR